MAGLDSCSLLSNAAIWRCQVVGSWTTDTSIKVTGFQCCSNHKGRKAQLWENMSVWRGTKRFRRHPIVPNMGTEIACRMSYVQRPKWVISRVALWDTQLVGAAEGPVCIEYAISSELTSFSEEETKAVNGHLVFCPRGMEEQIWKSKRSEHRGNKQENRRLQILEVALKSGSHQHLEVWRKLDDDLFGMKGFPSSLVEAMMGTQVQCDASRLQGYLISEDDFHKLLDDGKPERVLNVLDHQGIVPSVNMYVSLLKACVKRKSLAQAKAVYARLYKHAGLELITVLGDHLVSTLVRCGGLQDALHVFHRLPNRTVFSWTAIISCYTAYGRNEEALELYWYMREEGVRPNSYTFVGLLKACGNMADLAKGKHIHADAWKCRCANLFVCTSLIDMYRKCGSLVDAQHVFNGLFQRDVVAWTAMLTAYSEQGQAEEALKLYEQMQEEGLSPDARTIVMVLQACGIIADKLVHCQSSIVECLGKGKAIHARACKMRCLSDVYVGNTLISMYGKCGSIMDAEYVFDGLSNHDVVSWNAMLVVYGQQDHAEEVFQLYGQMREVGVSPDVQTFVSVLQACGLLAVKETSAWVDGKSIKVKSLGMGKALHAEASRKDCVSELFVGNTLVSAYGKCGSIVDARNVFDGLCKRDVVSWTVMLMSYVEQDQGEKALQLYRQMQEEGTTPDDMTIVWLVQACSNTGNLVVLKQIHRSLVTAGSIANPFVSSTIISAYGRCASMVDAQTIFGSLPQHEVISWTALIAGYAWQGECAESLQVYDRMQLGGVRPTGVTFLAVLSACGHAGMVYRGVEYFESMIKDHGITPGIEHYVSMVDLLGRAGHFLRIEHLMSAMPMKPNLAMWLCVLGACRKHGKVVLGEHAFARAIGLQPMHSAACHLMSNIYADAGFLERAMTLKELAQADVAHDELGRSWIHHEEDAHCFLGARRMHPLQRQLSMLLRNLKSKIMRAGKIQVW